ncbi:MAG: cytochrome P450 [Pseudomonadota bacterium]
MTQTAELVDIPKVPENIIGVVLNPECYADDRIYEAYAWLRQNSPVALVEHPDFHPFWMVTKYEDVKAVGLNSAVFRSGVRAYNLCDRKSIEHVLNINEGSPNLIASLVAMDAPQHSTYRRLTQKWFQGSNLRKREDEIRQIAKQAVDDMIVKGPSVDFVADCSTDYPLRVIMNILGVSEADWPLMLRLTQQNFGTKDPELSGEAEPLKEEQYANFMHAMVQAFTKFFMEVSEDRRRSPREDLSSIIANATVDGAAIPVDIEMGYYITIVTGGHDTTSSSTATAMWQLAQRPELFAQVKADHSLIPNLVEEAVRWTTPVKHFMRTASEDTTIGTQQIRKDDWVMLCYGSANRDEDAFPQEFTVDRSPNRHVAFGYGPHLCLGQHLAKMEMAILFEELLPRIKSVKLNGTPRQSIDWFVNGPKSVPVTFEYE